tara:strand:+ start:40228 stop:41319 length:1092 start_codon:yes stop_codon:yes gene_type:complete
MINLYTPSITENDKKLVNKALRETNLSGATEVINEFEDAFSKKYNFKYCLSTNSGTAALHLALLSSGIGKGDEVIIPSLSFIATANAVSYVGAKPVIVDVDRRTFQISLDEIKKNISKRTKAIIPVHLYGNSPDLNAINKISNEFNLKIIQDSAEALGTSYMNKPSGSFGDVGIYSFYPNKLITTGEGGMLVTSNKNIYRKAKNLRGQGLKENTNEYIHSSIGYNYRMNSLSAALGISQLKNVDVFLKRKIEIFQLYKEKLESENLEFIETTNGVENSHWLTVVSFRSQKININSLRKFLYTQNIETKKIFYPIDRQTIYKSKNPVKVSHAIYQKSICLPSSPNLTNKQISFVSNKIIKFLKD